MLTDSQKEKGMLRNFSVEHCVPGSFDSESSSSSRTHTFALHLLKCALLTSAKEINRGSATWGTSSWRAILIKTRKDSSGGVAEKTCSTPLWRTSVHTKRERWRGNTVVLLLVSNHLRPTGLRPVCVRASTPVAHSYTFLSHKY